MNLKRECFIEVEGERVAKDVKMEKDFEEKLLYPTIL